MNCDVTLRIKSDDIHISRKKQRKQLYNFEHMTRITISREKQIELEKNRKSKFKKKINVEI